ncbi:MerR family transcriptional regulator [Croceicoccus mobilis]|uniref:HTH merR-type domain-containing protein n=1 Tax=Croceicoccus mobilis TaxID=1703339 RepID=A0A916YYZ2_9SPHN|nr:hypothetical protein GCM10010990_16800 [Croceicoccus mobilis]
MGELEVTATTGLFNDGKDENAFRTIGEVAGALAIKPHVLRYWEEQFPMLKPVKRSGQRRYYRPEDISLLQTIDRLLNREGYTIKGAVRAIRTGQADEEQAVAAPSHAPAPAITRGPEGDLVEQLKALRETLAEVLV